DGAILFEQVTNALKLVGDQYLARVYSLASRRFHLGDWDASITRKLQTIDSIYAKMADRAASRRMAILEWIIIVLIAVPVAPSLAWSGRPQPRGIMTTSPKALSLLAERVNEMLPLRPVAALEYDPSHWPARAATSPAVPARGTRGW